MIYTCMTLCIYMYSIIGVATSLNETKEGGETSTSKKFSKRRNIGIAYMHEKYRRQDRDPGWLGHILGR